MAKGSSRRPRIDTSRTYLDLIFNYWKRSRILKYSLTCIALSAITIIKAGNEFQCVTLCNIAHNWHRWRNGRLARRMQEDERQHVQPFIEILDCETFFTHIYQDVLAFRQPAFKLFSLRPTNKINYPWQTDWWKSLHVVHCGSFDVGGRGLSAINLYVKAAIAHLPPSVRTRMSLVGLLCVTCDAFDSRWTRSFSKANNNTLLRTSDNDMAISGCKRRCYNWLQKFKRHRYPDCHHCRNLIL